MLGVLMRLLWISTEMHCGTFLTVHAYTRTNRKRKAGVSVLKGSKHFLKWMKAADDFWSLAIASCWVSKEPGRAAVIMLRIPPNVCETAAFSGKKTTGENEHHQARGTRARLLRSARTCRAYYCGRSTSIPLPQSANITEYLRAL